MADLALRMCLRLSKTSTCAVSGATTEMPSSSASKAGGMTPSLICWSESVQTQSSATRYQTSFPRLPRSTNQTTSQSHSEGRCPLEKSTRTTILDFSLCNCEKLVLPPTVSETPFWTTTGLSSSALPGLVRASWFRGKWKSTKTVLSMNGAATGTWHSKNSMSKAL